MRTFRRSLTVILLTVFSLAGSAAIRPSFGADSEAWRSTDIVLVSTLPADGVFEVMEVWKGSLRAGARVVVSQLIPAISALPIASYTNFWKAEVYSPGAEEIPRQPAGSHLILFLRRNPLDAQEPQWEPANSMDSMKASVVWMEGDQLCWFTQVINPGPSTLQCMGAYPLQKLKERVSQVTNTQVEMQSILASQGGTQKAQLLKPYVHSDIFAARQLALQELGNSGPEAVPAIREMLDNAGYAEQAPELIEAMVNSGGRSVGADLIHRLRRDVAFWESTGPSLPTGWWNQDANPDAPLRLRYLQTFRLIIGLQKIHDKDALAPAKELRDLWVANPQLNDPSGLNQMSLECGTLINMLNSD